MKKTQDKLTQQGSEAPSTSNLGSSSGTKPKISFPSNIRNPHTPVSNNSLQSRKNDTRDSIKLDSPADTTKKKNRRKIRKSKSQFDESMELPSSSGSMSPFNIHYLSKGKISSPLKDLSPLNNRMQSKQVDKSSKDTSTPKTTASKPLITTEFLCDIYAIVRPENGKAFRKRSKKYKYINLKSFLGSAETCVFETDMSRFGAAFKRLSLDSKREMENSDVSGKLSVSLDSKPKKKKRDDFSIRPSRMERKRHKEILIHRTTRDQTGSEVEESVLILEDSSVLNVSQDTSQGTPKKDRKPKKEKHKRHKLERKLVKEASEKFPEKYTPEMAKAGEESGQLIRGFIRVNPKNSRDAYVSNPNSTLSDYFLTSISDRNGALDGDEVLLKVKPQGEWQEGKQTATVVYILDKIHPRTTVGNLKPCVELGYAMFYPRDKRMPAMRIPEVCCPNGFKMKPKSFENILFVAKLLEWSHPARAVGVITDTLGLAGDLRVETLSILKEFCLDITPFSPEMVQFLPKSKVIAEEEIAKREDIRKECVFTIDPLTARDLDDAVSFKELPNGNYEIGVHISDASYYLTEGTPLDNMVSGKATTIYLVDTVYHMLPVELCLHCSLLPGEDKLAFSVFWEMNLQGEIFNTRFVRTVLNSCAQLAYEHAQQMIEDPSKEFKKEELPPIYNGFTGKDLSKTVNVLQKIAVNLREARVKNGSLRIDQVKLLFSLNPRNGEPTDFIVYENKESHRLIEEFMLLANISVAKKISETYPDIAFLRCHEPPKFTMLAEAKTSLETCGIHVDISSSGGIHSSLRKYITDDFQGLCRGIVLNHIFAKPMTRARYFCAGTMPSEEDHAHYALSVPIYTHFTSPIRRYADIMVHRLLAASLGYAEKPKWDMEYVITIAANCNKQKYNAKRAGEASSDLYLAHYIEKNQPYIQDCVVVDVKDRSFDAIVLKTGSIVRIYQKRCEDDPNWTIEAIPPPTINTSDNKSENEKKVLRLILQYSKTKKHPEPHKVIVELFSVVKVELKRVPNSYKLEAYLLRPVVSKMFERSASESNSSQIQSTI